MGAIDTIATDAGTKALQAMWERANVISNNIANSDTPGYTQETVDFESQLQSALSDNTLTATELSSVNPVVQQVSGIYGADSNGVDMEQQMVELARNQLQYSYLERGVSDNLGLLMTAAKGGK